MFWIRGWPGRSDKNKIIYEFSDNVSVIIHVLKGAGSEYLEYFNWVFSAYDKQWVAIAKYDSISIEYYSSKLLLNAVVQWLFSLNFPIYQLFIDIRGNQ